MTVVGTATCVYACVSSLVIRWTPSRLRIEVMMTVVGTATSGHLYLWYACVGSGMACTHVLVRVSDQGERERENENEDEGEGDRWQVTGNR